MKKKFVWLWVTFLLVAVLVLASCGETVPGEQEEEEEEEGIPTLSIGETFKSPEIEVTITETIVADSYEYYDDDSESTATKEASTGTSFLIIHVEIKNMGELVKYRVGPEQVYASDSEGNEYKAESSYITDAMEGVLRHRRYLRPGTKDSGKVLFIIPEEATDLKVFYKQIWPRINLAEWVIE